MASSLQFDLLEEDSEFLVDLGDGVWLMDNHKWALSVWDAFFKRSGLQRFSLVHADYHWDGGNDFQDASDEEQSLISASTEELDELIREEIWIRYDSFIAPAVIRGLISEVLFFCLQDHTDIGLDEEMLERFGARQHIFPDMASLVAHPLSDKPVFDLCLDLFNRSDDTNEGDIWPDDEIIGFLETSKELIRKASLVTISLSFGCSGTEEDTRRLAKLVVPIIRGWRWTTPT